MPLRVKWAQQVGHAGVMRPPGPFQKFIVKAEIKTAPAEFQVQANDDRWFGHTLLVQSLNDDANSQTFDGYPVVIGGAIYRRVPRPSLNSSCLVGTASFLPMNAPRNFL